MFNFKFFSRRGSKEPKTLVLMYHRIAGTAEDPWKMAVTPQNFEAQISFLKKNYQIISLDQMLDNLERKTIEPNTVCVTFDDGYADNYLTAKPILESQDCPATFFIATEYIKGHLPYWWDELERITLYAERLPRKISIKIKDRPFEFDLGESQFLNKNQLRQHRLWRSEEKPVSARCLLFMALYEVLIELPFKELQAAISELKCCTDDSETNETKRPMTISELREIVSTPQLQIGLHTATHAALSLYSEPQQITEIADGEKWLKKNGIQPTRVLAYPHGKFDETTLAVVAKCQLRAALTVRKQTVKKDSFRYSLGRFQVNNWNEREFRYHLATWFRSNDQ
jgi:peptidoglycan/xylan/chitin deacetylase (PgdA/CDA1 family)